MIDYSVPVYSWWICWLFYICLLKLCKNNKHFPQLLLSLHSCGLSNRRSQGLAVYSLKCNPLVFHVYHAFGRSMIILLWLLNIGLFPPSLWKCDRGLSQESNNTHKKIPAKHECSGIHKLYVCNLKWLFVVYHHKAFFNSLHYCVVWACT